MNNAATTVSQNHQSVDQPDLGAIGTRLHATWSSGDYALIGTILQIVGEELCQVLDRRSVTAARGPLDDEFAPYTAATRFGSAALRTPGDR